MKIRFLGTNGWYDSPTGNTTCTLVETKERYIILDAGNGLYKIDRYITKAKPISLFLSHYHLDHIIGLHILNKFAFKQGIDVFGPPGLKKAFKLVISDDYSKSLKDLKTKMRLHELSSQKSASYFEFKKLRHTVTCFGYRFCLESRVLAYCTDTGICDNLYKLARRADLLITECSYLPGQKDKTWPHLNPQDCAGIAVKAQVKKLAMIHFDASLYLTFRDRLKAQNEARRIFKDAYAKRDGDLEIIR